MDPGGACNGAVLFKLSIVCLSSKIYQRIVIIILNYTGFELMNQLIKSYFTLIGSSFLDLVMQVGTKLLKFSGKE